MLFVVRHLLFEGIGNRVWGVGNRDMRRWGRQGGKGDEEKSKIADCLLPSDF
jgi:hypothetical protein